MENRTCSICGEVIPKGRLEALPDTPHCRLCSTVVAYYGVDIVDGPALEDLIDSLQQPERG